MKFIPSDSELGLLCKENKISYLGVFGSYARGEENSKSDIDLLVSFKSKLSLFDLARIQNLFSVFFKKPVELVLEKSLNPLIKPFVEKDLITIYGER